MIVVISSRLDEPSFDLDELLAAIQNLSFRIYFGVTISLIIVLFIVSKQVENLFVDLMLVALFGGYTVLSTKALSTALSMNLDKMFIHPVTYISGFVLVLTAVVSFFPEPLPNSNITKTAANLVSK